MRYEVHTTIVSILTLQILQQHLSQKKTCYRIYPSTDFTDAGGRTRLTGLTSCEQLTSGNIYISQIPENKGYKNRCLPVFGAF